MKRKSGLFLIGFGFLFAVDAGAWEAKVTDILQHGGYVAVYLTPDPGPGNCQFGSPYLLAVDDSPESKQRFSMVMMALATGNKVLGYPDECASAIWGQSRPTIRRLMLRGG